jgi:hypothetical protein
LERKVEEMCKQILKKELYLLIEIYRNGLSSEPVINVDIHNDLDIARAKLKEAVANVFNAYEGRISHGQGHEDRFELSIDNGAVTYIYEIQKKEVYV